MTYTSTIGFFFLIGTFRSCPNEFRFAAHGAVRRACLSGWMKARWRTMSKT